MKTISDQSYRRSRRAASPLTPAGDPAAAARLARRPGAAFTLIEIMVTVGLLSFIILGLLAMFNQTSRAFRAGMTQTDILETGRSTMDMIAREVEQTYASHQPTLNYPNSVLTYRCTNFFVETPIYPSGFGAPWAQDLPGSSLPRTNLIQRFFFLSKINQDVFGTGYFVVPDAANANVGTLYRVMVTNLARTAPINLSSRFQNASVASYNRIADGVVHFRVRAAALNGFEITGSDNTAETNAWFRTGTVSRSVTNAVAWVNLGYPEWTRGLYFMQDAIPANVEIELGLLEDRTLARLRGIPDANGQNQFLQNHAGQVHLFRQRVPLRNVDPAVYQ